MADGFDSLKNPANAASGDFNAEIGRNRSYTDGFDPMKNPVNASSEDVNAQTGRIRSYTDAIAPRPSYNSSWKRQSSNDVNIQTYSPSEQRSKSASNKRLNFLNNAIKSSRKSSSSFEDVTQNSFPPSNDVNNQTYSPSEQQSKSASNKKLNFLNNLVKSRSKSSSSLNNGTQNSFPPSNVVNYLPQRSIPESEQSQVRIIEQENKPYWESGENPMEDWNENQPENYQGEDYGAQEEYYNNQKPYKKKGVSSKMNRLVRRFPVLGVFYKQPATLPDRNESGQEFQYNQPSAFVDLNQSSRELTADELALNQRYSDQTHMKLINLQIKEQTQPVDLRIHQETNKIYLCDIGRSVIEIYDINGTSQHVINDPTMTKFQPTALAIAFDETIILASHFNHCLHMYSPNNSQTTVNGYSYKQFKLGTQGNQIHQFYQPAGIAIDHKDGNLYVCDRGNYRIQVLRPEGLCYRLIELFVNDKKKYQLDPVRIAIQKNSDHIVCIVGAGDAICFIPKFTRGQIYIDPLYVFDDNGLGLEGASGLAIDAQDRIFISDTGHNRIVICTPEGYYITSFGTKGDGLGQLNRPCGLDITNGGTVVVTDPGNKRLQLFGLVEEQTMIENNLPKNNTAEEEHVLNL